MIKVNLHKFCRDILDNKKSALEISLADLNAALENESKSSAGDKHETSRAMLHLEIEKLNQQLQEINFQNETLLKLSADEKRIAIHHGSIIQTNRGTFYIAIALGKIIFENKELFVISQASPLSGKLMGKTINDEISVNGINYKIESII